MLEAPYINATFFSHRPWHKGVFKYPFNILVPHENTVGYLHFSWFLDTEMEKLIEHILLWPLLLTWINFNTSMDK